MICRFFSKKNLSTPFLGFAVNMPSDRKKDTKSEAVHHFYVFPIASDFFRQPVFQPKFLQKEILHNRKLLKIAPINYQENMIFTEAIFSHIKFFNIDFLSSTMLSGQKGYYCTHMKSFSSKVTPYSLCTIESIFLSAR